MYSPDTLLPRVKFFLICFCLLFLLAPVQAAQQKRIALVIGNSDYKDAKLKNPVNDATDIADKLEKSGFKVSKLTNASRRQMKRAIRKFGRKLRGENTVGFFYFAGHGVQVKGENYLIPVGVEIKSEFEVEDEAISANRILRAMDDAGNGLNLVVLDACRNNPFARSFRSSSRGLARMSAPKGSMILYATSPGDVAQDGSGRNGVFTKHLLKAMSQPGLQVEEVFKKTAIKVSTETAKAQVPWFEGVILGNFYFFGNNAKVPNTIINQPPPTFIPKADTDTAFWNSLDHEDADQLRLYQQKYPNGKYLDLAMLKLKKLNRPIPRPKDEIPNTNNNLPASVAGNIRWKNKDVERKFMKIYDDFQTKGNKRAIAIAHDSNGGWAWGSAYKYATLNEAIRGAIDRCNSARQTYGVKSPCIVFDASNTNSYVTTKPKPGNNNQSSTLSSVAGNYTWKNKNVEKKFMKVYDNFQKKGNQRAIAIAHDANGGWAWGSSYNYGTVKEAISSAVDRCNNSRKKYKVKSPCVVYDASSTNSYVVKDSNYAPFKTAKTRKKILAQYELYKKYADKKAIAYADDATEAWAAGYAYGYSTVAEARREAIKSCNKTRAKYKVKAPCTIYATSSSRPSNNSSYTFKTNSVRKKFLKEYKKFKSFSNVKAIAVADDSNGGWSYGYAYGYSNRREARKEAIKTCNKYRKKYNVKSACRFYSYH